MEAFKVYKDSWHYKLITKADPYDLPKDFCAYWRKVVLLCTGLALGISLASIILFTAFYALVVDPIAVIATILIITLIYTAGSIVSRIILYFSDNKKVTTKINSPKQPSLLMVKYRSWKQKYCPMVEYEE